MSDEVKPVRIRKGYFTHVAAAREALKARAHEILKLYIHNAKLATKNKDYETAKDSYEFLLEHMPPDAEGQRIVVNSIDKVPEGSAKSLPTINIGFNLGGLTPKQLGPKPVAIDVVPIEDPEDPKG